MKNVLVTGGAGFIGSEFVRQAVSGGEYDRVFVLDSLTYAGDLNRISSEVEIGSVEFIQADLNDVKKYESVLSEISSVVHFAAESHVDRSIENGYAFVQTNILGTFSLLEATRNFPKILNMIVSTDEVYGSVLDGESSERDILEPSSAYSASKSASDLICLAQFKTHNQAIIITRCCNNYGPYQHSEKVIPTFINYGLNNRKLPIYGTGKNVREWINVKDHVRSISTLIESGTIGEIYNIGTGFRIDNLSLAETILSLLELPVDFIDFIPDRKGHDVRYALNSTKVMSQTKWKPKIGFNEGLSDTVKWYRELYLSQGSVI